MEINNQKQETALFYSIEELFFEGKLQEALLLLDLIKEDSQNFSKALFYKSMLLGIIGEDEDSFEYFKKYMPGEDAVDLDENYKPIDMNDPQDLFDCGLTNFYFGDYKKAVEFFDLSLKKLPNQSEVIYYKALSLANMGNYKKALNVINHAISLQPENSHYWNDKGAFLSELNHVDKAHKCFDKSIKLEADSINWANKAALYHKNNDLKNAMKCYDNAIELDREDVYPVVGKAKIYMELDDFDSAEKYFKLAESIDGSDSEYLIERGKFFIYNEDYEKAIRCFDKCLKFNDELAFVWMFKSMALKELRKVDEAEKCVEKALEMDSEILLKFEEFF